METHLSSRYSSLLDVEDVEYLFEKLKQANGSISKAVVQCGVARSTVYGWQKANYVKSVTKMKILKASLEKNLIETLGFITSRSKERTSDLLFTYLSSIYQKALREDRGSFQNLLKQILDARRVHFGLIQDSLQDEVSEMLSVLTERAREFRINLPEDSLDMIRSSYLLKIIPDLTRDIFVEAADVGEIANRYSVPLEVPRILEESWKAITPKFPETFAQQITPGEHWVDFKRLVQPVSVARREKSSAEWAEVDKLSVESSPPVIARGRRSACVDTDTAKTFEPNLQDLS